MKHNPVSGVPIFPLTDPPNVCMLPTTSTNNNSTTHSASKGNISLRMGLNNILINPRSSSSASVNNNSQCENKDTISNSQGQAMNKNHRSNVEESIYSDEIQCHGKVHNESDTSPIPPPASASTTSILEAAAAATAHPSNLIFPFKLLEIIENETPSVIEWTPSGKGFYIKDGIRDVLPKYFRQTKLQSFQRQLNLYGFSRMNKGPECGAYYHAKFSRDRPELIGTIKRLPGHGARATARAVKQEMGSNSYDGIENSDKSDGDNNVISGHGGYSMKEKYGNQSIALNGSGNKSSENHKEKDVIQMQQQQQQQRIIRQQHQSFGGFTAYHQTQAGHITVQGLPHSVNIVPAFSHSHNIPGSNPNGTLNTQKHNTAKHSQVYGLGPAYGSHVQHQQAMHSQHFHHPPHTQNSYISTVNVNGHPRTIQVLAIPANYNPGGPQQSQQLFRGAPQPTQQLYNGTNNVINTTNAGSISGGNSANNSKTTTPINSSSTPPNASNTTNNLNSVSNLTLGPAMIQNQQHPTTSQFPPPVQILNPNNLSHSSIVKQPLLPGQPQQQPSMHLGKQGNQTFSVDHNNNNSSNDNITLASSTNSCAYVPSQSTKSVEQINGNNTPFHPHDGRKCEPPSKIPTSSSVVLVESSMTNKSISNEVEGANKEENSSNNRRETFPQGEKEKQDGDEVSECGRLRSLSVVSESEVDTEGEGNASSSSASGRKRKSGGNMDNNTQKVEFSSPVDMQGASMGQGEYCEPVVYTSNCSSSSSSSRISASSPSRCVNVNNNPNINLINQCQYKERVPLTERVKQGIIHPTSKGRERASTISSMPLQTNMQPIRSQYAGGHPHNISTSMNDSKREDISTGSIGCGLSAASVNNFNSCEMRTDVEMGAKIENTKELPTSAFGEDVRYSPVLGMTMDTRTIPASKLSKRVKVTPTNEDRRLRMSRSLQASPVGSSKSLYPSLPTFSLENGPVLSVSNNCFANLRANSNCHPVGNEIISTDQLCQTYDIKMKYEEDFGSSEVDRSILDTHLDTSEGNGFSFHYFEKTTVFLSRQTDTFMESNNMVLPIKTEFDPIERKMISRAVKLLEQGERVCLLCAQGGRAPEAQYFPQITPFQISLPPGTKSHPLCFDKLKICPPFVSYANVTYSRKKIDSLNEIKHAIRCALILGVGEKNTFPNPLKHSNDQITFFSNRNTVLMISAEWGLKGGEEDLVMKGEGNSDKKNDEGETMEITPEDMAFCYQEVLQEEKYIGLYKAIHFILPNFQSPEDQGEADSTTRMNLEDANISKKNPFYEGKRFHSDEKYNSSSLYFHGYPPARIYKAFSQILGSLIVYRHKPEEKSFDEVSSVNMSREGGS